MCDRSAVIDSFLAETVWRSWKRQQIAGDASARRYLRLTHQNQSVIVMDAPPEAGDGTQSFADIAKLLTAHGLSAPDIMAQDMENGLMVLTDLGDHDFVSWLRSRPQDDTVLYRTTAHVLSRISDIPAPGGLVRMTPQVGADMIGITGEFYAGRDVTDLRDAVYAALDEFAPLPDTLALRDFHAGNLIWRDAHTGVDRVGLLDFQDAFIAPSGYDLASLLRDARRDVPEALVQNILSYFIEITNASRGFRTQVACLSVQRNLRILGVFARLSKTQGKTHYLEFIPRVWKNILVDLQDPALGKLREAVLDILPAPSPDFCESLKP